jgi:hypothetical protein
MRVCCEFHYQNVETFRSLHGYRYLEKFIWETYLDLLTEDTERSLSNVCEEIVRAFDVIGYRVAIYQQIKLVQIVKYSNSVNSVY